MSEAAKIWLPPAEEPEDTPNGPDDVWYVDSKGVKATSLEKFNVMHAYGSRKGGILMPPPLKLTFKYYQSPWVERRLAETLREQEQDRIREETGLEVFPAVPLSELCDHDFVRGPDGVSHKGQHYSRHICRTCGVYVREAL